MFNLPEEPTGLVLMRVSGPTQKMRELDPAVLNAMLNVEGVRLENIRHEFSPPEESVLKKMLGVFDPPVVDHSAVFSGRAESSIDAATFAATCSAQRKPWVDIRIENLGPLVGSNRDSGEVGFELVFSSPQRISEIIDVLRSVPDGHVMLQTLQPMTLEENSAKTKLARNYEVE